MFQFSQVDTQSGVAGPHLMRNCSYLSLVAMFFMSHLKVTLNPRHKIHVLL